MDMDGLVETYKDLVRCRRKWRRERMMSIAEGGDSFYIGAEKALTEALEVLERRIASRRARTDIQRPKRSVLRACELALRRMRNNNYKPAMAILEATLAGRDFKW